MPQLVDIELPHLYEARDYQDDFWDALHLEGAHKDKNYIIYVLNWHRRAGKDVTCWNAAIERTAETAATTKYVFPTNDMARDNLWEESTNDGVAFTDFVPKSLRVRNNKSDDGLNESLKRIRFITGGSIRVLSGHVPSRVRGGNSKTYVLSELQIMDPQIIGIIRPIIEANGGILIVNLTSNGDSAAKKLVEVWKKDPSVYVSVLTVEDTNIFSTEQMERIRRQTIDEYRAMGLSDEEANAFVDQEYYCSWDSPVVGSYFGAAMRRADVEGRITSVPHEELLPVETWWDLGVDDSMSIWFVQLFNREIRLIDYYENSGEGFAHYAKVLAGQMEGFEHMKHYLYNRHFAPHDITVRNLGETAKSREEIAKSLGINFTKVKKIAHKEDGIEATRGILSRCWFDEKKCWRGISGLKGYKKEWNSKLMVFSSEPVHDWTSHPSDAMQTGALTKPSPMSGKEGGHVVRRRTHGHSPKLVSVDGEIKFNLTPKRRGRR